MHTSAGGGDHHANGGLPEPQQQEQQPKMAPSPKSTTNQTLPTTPRSDELADARRAIDDIQRTCTELQHKVRSLEGAKLLWEITRMSMEFQSIKDLDETHRQRSELEDALIASKHRARHYEQEHATLAREAKVKDARLATLEAKVVLLSDDNLLARRLSELEDKVKELEDENAEHETREAELVEQLDVERRREQARTSMTRSSSSIGGRMTRTASTSSFVKDVKAELWNKVNPAAWLRSGAKKTADAARDVTTTYPDLELLNLLKREVPKLTTRSQHYNRHSIS
ncbi:Aste57867_833 [Aphanomyces stellatus]|uniref:Aste57867_833 protein n=1 Tax=Aphanomyces stellatus TaxID=120398 RepID=A0A485K7Q9_9STRA|nr:hypothetical protein As57867_000832 [Aphanomyces stellatus]VFT78057.1 Aste57867_833 [Aphanomyces stellatus]